MERTLNERIINEYNIFTFNKRANMISCNKRIDICLVINGQLSLTVFNTFIRFLKWSVSSSDIINSLAHYYQISSALTYYAWPSERNFITWMNFWLVRNEWDHAWVWYGVWCPLAILHQSSTWLDIISCISLMIDSLKGNFITWKMITLLVQLKLVYEAKASKAIDNYPRFLARCRALRSVEAFHIITTWCNIYKCF